jgi:acetyl esterase/lipase
MKTLLLMAMALLVSFCSSEQNIVELPLWADGAPNSNELTGEEEDLEGGRVANVLRPSITVYPASNPNGIAIIMCPGGGYARLAMHHEGHDMADWMNKQGITYAVLKYRMPNGHSDVPLSDAEQAIRLVRQHAAAWKVDPNKVGIMGASAGGHLAASLATCYSGEDTRPNFQILFYPVISMKEGTTHGGSRYNLLGKHPSPKEVNDFSFANRVTPQTPQAFIMLSADDGTVVPPNSIEYFTALNKNNVPVSLHIYPTGGHGWGFRDSFTYKSQWTGELEKWIRTNILTP